MKPKTIKVVREAPLGKVVRIKETNVRGKVTSLSVDSGEQVQLGVRVPSGNSFTTQWVAPDDCEPYVERRIGFVGDD